MLNSDPKLSQNPFKHSGFSSVFILNWIKCWQLAKKRWRKITI